MLLRRSAEAARSRLISSCMSWVSRRLRVFLPPRVKERLCDGAVSEIQECKDHPRSTRVTRRPRSGFLLSPRAHESAQSTQSQRARPEDVAHLRRDEQLIFEMLPHLRFVGPGVSPHTLRDSHAAPYVSPHPLLLTLTAAIRACACVRGTGGWGTSGAALAGAGWFHRPIGRPD